MCVGPFVCLGLLIGVFWWICRLACLLGSRLCLGFLLRFFWVVVRALHSHEHLGSGCMSAVGVCDGGLLGH